MVSAEIKSKGSATRPTDPLGHTTNYTYDGNGNPTSITTHLDANTPVSTFYTYNNFGEVLTTTDPLGNTTISDSP